jgi:hypothetical protein
MAGRDEKIAPTTKTFATVFHRVGYASACHRALFLSS